MTIHFYYFYVLFLQKAIIRDTYASSCIAKQTFKIVSRAWNCVLIWLVVFQIIFLNSEPLVWLVSVNTLLKRERLKVVHKALLCSVHISDRAFKGSSLS